MRAALDGAGTTDAGITRDYDGQSRSDATDIGPVEFVNVEIPETQFFGSIAGELAGDTITGVIGV